MARIEIDEVTGREIHYPETKVERIAWAVCAHHSSSAQGYLRDDELEGLEALLRAMARRCGNARAEADFLGITAAAALLHIPAIKQLAKHERYRRDNRHDPVAVMHLTASYWRDYLPEAEAISAELTKVGD